MRKISWRSGVLVIATISGACVSAAGCGGDDTAPADAPVEAGPQMCPSDAGASFCRTGTSYVCADGIVGTGTACVYGCDAVTGTCADIVPASQARAHLAVNDTFTCTGTQSGTLG